MGHCRDRRRNRILDTAEWIFSLNIPQEIFTEVDLLRDMYCLDVRDYPIIRPAVEGTVFGFHVGRKLRLMNLSMSRDTEIFVGGLRAYLIDLLLSEGELVKPGEKFQEYQRKGGLFNYLLELRGIFLPTHKVWRLKKRVNPAIGEVYEPKDPGPPKIVKFEGESLGEIAMEREFKVEFVFDEDE